MSDERTSTGSDLRMLTVRIPNDLVKWLRLQSALEERPMQDLVREALHLLIQKHQDDRASS